MVIAARVFANDPGSINGTTESFTGNQSSGVTANSPPILTLDVSGLVGPIQPGSGVTGISLQNNSAANLTINSGVVGQPVVVLTTGSNALGISAVSLGSPPQNPPNDPFLGVPIPTASTVSGGVVNITSDTNITTTGANAYGIQAQSSTTGYPSSVVNALNNFSATGFSFAVNEVFNADGTAGMVGSAVSGSLVDANGNVIPGAGGTFAMNANGTYSFNPGTAFSSLAVGQSENTSISYGVLGTNPSNGTEEATGVFIVTVTQTATGLTITPVGANFNLFGSSATTLPDLQSYVSSLVSVASASGAGNSVTVTNNGSIQTSGAGAIGIYATSQGGGGAGGSNASILHSSSDGSAGSMGGAVTVTANGTITIGSSTNPLANTPAVLAWSTGGNGGGGGDSGYTRSASVGGNGATGGNVTVLGNGTIITYGDYSSGILALSQGGNGGDGGSGSTFNSGTGGGNGGAGGTVYIDGTWNITTNGNQANGIWGKSFGGVAGSGGNGGWTGTSSGGGGIGTNGGTVTIDSGGLITTVGNNSYGIYGESIGGFGGSGGNGTSIFYASGGSGASAGSGGNVIITNEATGVITTHGTDAYAIIGQSIGGGGGSGGGSTTGIGSIAGFGGGGSTGGDGGAVTITNYGQIYTIGAGSKGIYAQSVGGGGGDGGNSTGAFAVGGGGSATSNGGNVIVVNTGTIETTSNAIFAQSIGGGGGNGGSSSGWFSFGGTGGGGGAAGTVMVTSNGTLSTSEQDASAIFAQSVGGGGGNGGNSTSAALFASLAIGGTGGTAGAGDDVTVGVNGINNQITPVTGTITTTQAHSRGIEAQSVGGGGGNGGYAFSGSISTGASISIGIGGNGGGGGGAGNVEVLYGDANSSITTGGLESQGIFAQSVGGGGGAGGFSIAATAGGGLNAAISLGGIGGTGGGAGTVTVGSLANFTGGTITTTGAQSDGIFAQSVGGGGGAGGFSVSATLTLAGGSLSFGGPGGAGGAGNTVTVYNGSTISTSGDDSHGIFAQSVGGGGGAGGMSIAATVSTSVALNLAMGGSGGMGNTGGAVTVDSIGGTITTTGDRSYGILAQSVGGSGGDGGFSIAAGISAAPSVGLSMGGLGGTGSTGGAVTVVDTSNITTSGDDSHALVAQSIGGGGGTGGFSVAASISINPVSPTGAAVNASLGGSGGTGGDSSTVTVTSGGTLMTGGTHSDGILAQSIGGGGGDGGFSVAGGISTGPAVSFAMGGNGGVGGNGGMVFIDSSGNITTTGDDSNAIIGQSVGGGGGNGGFSIAGAISVQSAGVSASIGGSGSGGGDGLSVTVGNNNAITGTIKTSGNGSNGIVAQSIGGGGGNGGFSVAGSLSSSAAVGFTMGGSGGPASGGGAVTVDSGANISTTGSDANAVFAQSIGGGGGNGGFSIGGDFSTGGASLTASIGGSAGVGGAGGTVTVTSTGVTLKTGGDSSDGILAQSIGGGGGNGGFSFAGSANTAPAVTFSLGGSGATGGDANTVTVNSSSNITTTGASSNGIVAQSIGGGGGNGGFSVAGSLSLNSAGVSATIGGTGGAGADAGNVYVGTNTPITGTIMTSGVDSNDIVAQSIGGGGGNGGFSVAGDFSSSAAVGFTMGGAGGTASLGQTVMLISGASVSTTGANSNGLFAQSIGGGGGDGGFSIGASLSSQSAAVTASVGGSGGKGGSGGAVTLDSTGTTLSTTGNGSDAILAQSIGGGGGDGGFSVVGGISKSASVNVGVGGTGGLGGDAGTVNVTNSSSITTTGEIADGLVAQSIGGGGGSGGFSLTGSVSTSSSGVGFSIGGQGGVAGAGNTVYVMNSGDITTGNGVSGDAVAGTGTLGNGNGSYGILAQSIGGGGGDGGFSGTFAGSLASGPMDKGNGLSVSVGGSAGAGGGASTVQVTNSGLINTTALGSAGIFAQSIGGGGGDGGFSLAASLEQQQMNTALSVSIGGNAGGGGNGSTVTISNTNTIETLGDNSQGILAQSVGGGGGNGGFSIAGDVATGDQVKSASVSVGGQGGGGGNADLVSVTNSAVIGTQGDDSSAIQAQSIGGGGGDGGFSISGSFAGTQAKSLSVSIGGDGQTGGFGGTVQILSSGTSSSLTTIGDRSDGVLAQSIGGGGGNGGFSGSVALALGGNNPNTPSTSVSVAVGGGGGTGNIGGTVEVGLSPSTRFVSDITTSGEDSVGILAQSIGGGGGTGGYALSGSINLAAGQNGPNYNVAVAVGGGGGSGNDGGTVSVYHSGTITTAGDSAYGIEAQSIGGGGGNGGDARSFTLQLGQKPTPQQTMAGKKNASLSLAIGGNGAGGGAGNVVTVDNIGDITTYGGDSYGILAQSIGGGGGVGGDGTLGIPGTILLRSYSRSSFAKSLTIAVGGSGGSSGDANTVNVTEAGNVTTYGDGSHGILAQSIGGGGGEGGNGDIGSTGKIGIGGGTGSTGNGGAVNVTVSGTVTTYGNGANGIFAQSIGGGGGAAGDVTRGLANYLNVGIGVAFGQGSGNGGNGGAVTIMSTANISTQGTGSNGILAQSIGGGGGVAGSLGNDLPVLDVLNFAGSVGGAGSGSTVNVTENGAITTSGDASNGIFAQSAGGQGTGGVVNVMITGSILTSGAESNGILAQSVGMGGQNNITVIINSGTIQGGTDTGAGVRFMDGLNNQLTSYGTIQTLAGMGGTSIVGTGGNETVDNYGTVNDSIDLGSGTNTLNNHVGALLQSGNFINLGAGNVLNDAGTISPGGIGTVQTTNLTGNFNLTGNSSWIFDLTPTFSSDLFAISGTAQLGSFVNSVNLNEIGIATSAGTYTLITAASGLTGNFQFGSMTGGTMPVGYTFNLVNSDTQEQLTLTESTGPFYWRGTVDNTWNGAFLNGQDNWTSDAAGTAFIFGTPGVLCDVYFASTNVNSGNLMTTLGADFAINSLTIDTPNAVGIGGNNTLTIAAGSGAGITVEAGSGATTISANVALGGNQTWLNQSSNLLSVTGATVIGSGMNLTVDGTGNTLISAAIQTGAGSLTKNGIGTLSLSGASTYSGGTILNAGTLNIDTSSIATGVTPAVSPVSSGPLGTGLLTINGGIVGTSTDTGLNTIHAVGNDVQVNANFAVSNVVTPAPLAPLSSIDGGVLNSLGAGLFNSDGVDFAGRVALNQPGLATVITTNSGFLALTGSIHDLTPGTGGGLTFAGNTFTYMGSAGAANLGLKQIVGQLDVSNTYAGTTTVASGVLVLGKNNNAVAIPGNLQINAGAVVEFDGANSVNRVGAFGTTPNQIATTSSVVDNGVLDIAGINQTIAALYGNGIVQLSDANLIYGTGVGAIGVLTVGSGSFGGVVEDVNGGSQLVKVGPGMLTLTGNSTYPGGTFVEGGILAVEGSLLSGQIYVEPGATLKGTGFLIGNVINNGTVSPGNSPGTLRIAQNYTQTAGGSLTIEIGGTAPGLHDLLAIQGNAMLNGNLQLVQLGNFRWSRGESIVFLTAEQGITGRFTSVENPFTSRTILEPSVVYGSSTVALELVQGSFAQLASRWGLTPNESAVAGALDRVVNDSREANLINWLDDRELKRLPKDFDKISPEELTSIFTIGTALANVQAMNLERRAEDIRNGVGGFSAQRFAMTGASPNYSGDFNIASGVAGPNGNDGQEGKEMATMAPAETRWGAFLSGTGEWVSVGNTENARGYNLDSGGFTVGVDYKLTPNFAVGLMAGYTGTTSDLSDHGRVWVNGGKLGVYSTVFAGGWYADMAGFGGYNSFDTRRSALDGDTRGNTAGGEVDAVFGTGYDFKAGGLTFGPTATFNYTYEGTTDFAEHGSLAPLDIHGGEGESLRTALGLKASYDWKVGGIVIKPELRAAWQHEYGDAVYSLNSSFANGGGSSFLVNGPQIGRDSALLGAGFAIQFNERLSTYLYYDGELGRKNYQSTSITGGIRVAF